MGPVKQKPSVCIEWTYILCNVGIRQRVKQYYVAIVSKCRVSTVCNAKQNSSVSVSYTVLWWTMHHFCRLVYWSPPQLGVIIVNNWFCLSVPMSVCHAPSNCFFVFVSWWNQAMFWPSVLHVALYKTVFFEFWFRPPKVQNVIPKICTKSPISRLAWQIDRRCLGLAGGFRGWPIQWNHAKCGADPCCHGNKIWARRRDPVAYRLVS